MFDLTEMYVVHSFVGLEEEEATAGIGLRDPDSGIGRLRDFAWQIPTVTLPVLAEQVALAAMPSPDPSHHSMLNNTRPRGGRHCSIEIWREYETLK